ncbi:MAG: tetratricopeptide repeat protein, partial [Candidatus Eremiobacterota bacterium]
MSASTLDTRIQEALELSEAGQAEGLEQLVKLCQEHPDSACVWRARAQAEGELGQGEDALHSINRALQMAPADPENWGLKAEILLDLDRTEDALCALDTGLDKVPEDPDL